MAFLIQSMLNFSLSFNHIDKLFVYGKLDYKHFNHLKKHNTIFSLQGNYYFWFSKR